MDTQNLLATLSHLFDSSTPRESQQLFKQIQELALKKISVNRENSEDLCGKSQLKPIKRRMIKRRRDNRRKRKFISRQKLKQSAIRKISRDNKKLHQKHFDKKNLQSSKLAQAQPVSKGYSFQVHSDNQEQKLQSQQSSFEAKCSAIHSTRGNFSSSIVSLKPSHRQTCPKIHIQRKFKKTRKNFQTYLQSKQAQSKIDQLACPICIETLIDPVSTICGHSFCHRCLDESLLFAPTCPVCRLNIKGQEMVLCQYLQQLIRIKCNEFLEDKEALEVYKMRKEQNEEWKKARIIDSKEVRQGLILDVRDTESIWCQARVAKVYAVGSRIHSVLVHYLQWAQLYNEIIEIKSSRLAPQGHFSSRTDIPRYNLTQQEQNLRGAVIMGANNNMQNLQMQRPQPQLSFSNILQLDSLRNTINTINVIRSNFLQRRQQDENVFIPIVGRQENDGLNNVNFFGHLRGNSDDESQNDEDDLVSWREMVNQDDSQFQFQQQQEISPSPNLNPIIFDALIDLIVQAEGQQNFERLFADNSQDSVSQQNQEQLLQELIQPQRQQQHQRQEQNHSLQSDNNSWPQRRINYDNSQMHEQENQSNHIVSDDHQRSDMDCEDLWMDDASQSDQ